MTFPVEEQLNLCFWWFHSGFHIIHLQNLSQRVERVNFHELLKYKMNNIGLHFPVISFMHCHFHICYNI